MKQKGTYQLNWILIGLAVWEVFFWGIFFFVHISLDYWTGGTAVENTVLRYEHPTLLYGLIALLPLNLIFIQNIRWKNKVLKKSFAPHLISIQFRSFSTFNTFVKYFFFRNGIAFLIIALANPQFGTKKVVGKSESIELIVALDISNSMKVTDMEQRQNRLESAKNGITQLINHLHGDKIGLVVFAGSAYPQLPLTSDYAAAKLFVNEVSPEMISNQGTNIADAIQLAVRSFSHAQTSKVILLMTDGEDQVGGAEAAIQQAHEKGIRINVVGFGSQSGGPIPLATGGFKKDENNEIIVSKPNPALIATIAQTGGGDYQMVTSAYPDFTSFLNQANNMKKGLVDVDNFVVNEQQGLFFAVLALICFFASFLWTTSRWGVLDYITKIR